MIKLQAQQLSIALGEAPILSAVPFELKAGQMLGLIGPNGAGKTTLLRLLAGLLTADSGSITLDGVDYQTLAPQLRAQKISYLAQSGTAHWPMSVERIIELGRLPHLSNWQKPSTHDGEIIQRTMQQTDVTQFKDRLFNTLSGGERARVLLARALAAEPEILLADEPVSALDLAHQLEVMSSLKTFCENGGAAVVVLHDLRLAAHYCHRLLMLNQGQVLAEGPPEEVLTENNMEHAFGIKMREGAGAMANSFKLPWERT